MKTLTSLAAALALLAAEALSVAHADTDKPTISLAFESRRPGGGGEDEVEVRLRWTLPSNQNANKDKYYTRISADWCGATAGTRTTWSAFERGNFDIHTLTARGVCHGTPTDLVDLVNTPGNSGSVVLPTRFYTAKYALRVVFLSQRQSLAIIKNEPDEILFEAMNIVCEDDSTIAPSAECDIDS